MLHINSASSLNTLILPDMNKPLALLLMLASVSTGCTVIKNYKDITKAPTRSHQALELPSTPSNIDVALKLSFAELEQEINTRLGNEIKGGDNGTLKAKKDIQVENPLYNPNTTIKTKDPLYDPNEWLLTKDPLYSKKKWLSKPCCKNPLYHPNKWLKAKNPLYHPNEWIATNNPLYQPNRWIKTDGPEITVGYNYEYTITKPAAITLTQVDEATLKVTVPLKFSGSAGLEGTGAELLTLDKKNFKGAVDFYAKISLSIDSTWRPVAKVSITHDWTQKPVVEIMGGVNVSLAGLADSYLKKFEKEISETIVKKAGSALVKDEVNKLWKHYEFPLDSLPNGKRYYVNINPMQVSMSRLNVKPDSLHLFLGLQANVSIDDNPVNITKSLPALRPKTSTGNGIHAYVPISVKYTDIEQNVNKYLDDSDVVFTPTYKGLKAKIKLKKVYIYPVGNEIAIGVNMKVRLPGNLLPALGTAYLTALPVIKNGNVLELDSIKLSMNVNNKFYPAVAAAFKQDIIKEIKKHTKRDLSEILSDLEGRLAEQAEKANTNEKVSVSATDIKAGVHKIELLKDDLSIIAEMSCNLNIAMRQPKIVQAQAGR
jgi:hypothetical protein